jgi:hypothetical protein
VALNQELKDFLNGWSAVTKIKGAYDDAAYKRKRGQALDTQMALSNAKLSDMLDPERRQLEKDVLRSRANYLNSGGQRTRGGAVPENYDNAPLGPAAIPDTSVGPTSDAGTYNTAGLADVTGGTTPEPETGVQGAIRGGLIKPKKKQAIRSYEDGGYVPIPDASLKGFNLNTRAGSGLTASDGTPGGFQPIEGPYHRTKNELLRKFLGREHPDQKTIEDRLNANAKSYEDGGVVEEDDEDDAGSGGTTALSASANDTSLDDSALAYGGLSVQAGHDAAHGGTMQNLQQHGLHQPGVAMQQPANAQGYLRGKGAAGPMLSQAVLDKVDPKHQLTEGQRKFAALSAIWQYHSNKGEPEKAKRAAGAMLQQYRIDAGHYAALARAAADNGKIDDAVHLANKAYANVPDGRELKLENRNGTIIATGVDGATGKTISKKVLSPQEFYGALAKIQPHDFDKTLVEAAGQRYKQEKQPKGSALGGEKAAEPEKRGAMISKAMGETEGTPDAKNDVTRSIADHLHRVNGGTPQDSVDMAKMLQDPALTPERKQAPGGANVRFKGGRQMFVPDDLIERIAEIHTEKDDAASREQWKGVKEDDEAIKNPKSKGFIEGATRAVKGALDRPSENRPAPGPQNRSANERSERYMPPAMDIPIVAKDKPWERARSDRGADKYKRAIPEE